MPAEKRVGSGSGLEPASGPELTLGAEMPALSELLFRWERSEQLGLRFVCQSGVDAHRMHADPGGAGGETNVVVQQCLAVREIEYTSKRFGLTCTHTIVPGMAIEAVQGRHVDQISPEAPNEAKKAIAKFLNEYTFQKNGPLKLHFREEVGRLVLLSCMITVPDRVSPV